MQDKIERKITIKASKERVYEAITDSKQITSWFPDAVEGNIVEGEQVIFDFGEYGKTSLNVVAMHPHDYFAFRWVPGGANLENDLSAVVTTLVEFRITEIDGSSTVTMIESGFDKLPHEIAEQSFKQNNGGWDHMFERLGKIY